METNKIKFTLKTSFLAMSLGLVSLSSSAQVKDPIEDQGMTGELHKANVGKIVFSSNEIVKSETYSGVFANSFNLGEDIYGRIYLHRSLTNEERAAGVDADFIYRITVDGKEITNSYAAGNYKISGDAETYNTWTTFQLAISPKQEWVAEYPRNEVYPFFSKMYGLSDGSHLVKIEAVMEYPNDASKNKVIASGEFTLNVTQEGKTKAGLKLCPDMAWLNNTNDLVPNAFELIDAIKRPNEKILKVVVLSLNWQYMKDAYGRITTAVLIGEGIAQDETSKLCYKIDLSFYQENISNGGNSYGPTKASIDGKLEANSCYIPDCLN